MDVEKPGRALSRDIATSRSPEAAERELERFIEHRSVKLGRENQQHAEEAAWRASTKKANAAREAALREEWSSYHLDQAARHRAVLEALATHHEQRAYELMGGPDAA